MVYVVASSFIFVSNICLYFIYTFFWHCLLKMAFYLLKMLINGMYIIYMYVLC